MIRNYTFPGLATRVLCGSGTLAQTGEEIARLGHSRVLMLSTAHQRSKADARAARLGGPAIGVFSGTAMHTPTNVTEAALVVFATTGTTAVVARVGGSTAGMEKLSRCEVVVTTTCAGSEITNILGETAGGTKTTRRDPAIRPEAVIYDVDLKLTLLIAMKMASGLNAMSHAMEAFYAADRNPIIELMCRDALRAFKSGLPILAQDPQNRPARTEAQ